MDSSGSFPLAKRADTPGPIQSNEFRERLRSVSVCVTREKRYFAQTEVVTVFVSSMNETQKKKNRAWCQIPSHPILYSGSWDYTRVANSLTQLHSLPSRSSQNPGTVIYSAVFLSPTDYIHTTNHPPATTTGWA